MTRTIAHALITWVCLKDGFDPNAAINARSRHQLERGLLRSERWGQSLELYPLCCDRRRESDEASAGFTWMRISHFLNQDGDASSQLGLHASREPVCAGGRKHRRLYQPGSQRQPSTTGSLAANEITMVNLWATWCPTLRRKELPELEQISRRLQKLGCGVIILTGQQRPGEARDIIRDSGVTLPCSVARRSNQFSGVVSCPSPSLSIATVKLWASRSRGHRWTSMKS